MRRIRTLAGHEQVPTALICLRSLYEQSVAPIRIVVHGDGTLSDADCAKLKKAVPDLDILKRDEIEDQVLSALERFPNCRSYREESPMGLKLFDVALLEESPQISYCDTDILFVKRFGDLFSIADGIDAKFSSSASGWMRNAYAAMPWMLEPIGDITLIDSVCAGLFSVRRSIVDLNFLEWLLGRIKRGAWYRKRIYWVEQTCWSALAARHRCRIWDFGQVTIPYKNVFPNGKSIEKAVENAVAVHFVSPVRGDLKRFKHMRQDEYVEDLKLRHPRFNNCFRQLFADTERSLANRTRSWTRRYFDAG